MSDNSVEAQILRFPDRETAAPSRPSLTAGDVIRAYLVDLRQQRDAGEITRDHYDNVARSLQPAPEPRRYLGFADQVGDRSVETLKQYDLQQWLRANPTWKSDETKRRNLAAVLACFHWAHDVAEIIDRCPYKKTRREKLRRVERRDATDAEFAAICAGAPEHLRRLIVFMDETGVRTCESRLIRWADVSWEERVIVLDEHKTVDQTDEPDPRLIGLTADFVALLGQWRTERRKQRESFANPDDGRILVNSKGRPWTRRSLCHAFRRLRSKLKLPKDLTLYCLRHRCGTQLSMAGMSDREVGERLGHRDPRTTRRYTHLKKRAHVASIADKAAELRRKKQESQPPT